MSLTSYHEVLRKNAVLKRFNERWVADPNFRQALAEDKLRTLNKYGISCNPDDVKTLTEVDSSKPSATWEAMWQIVVAKSNWVNQFYKQEALPSDRRIRYWRDRQIARQLLELGPFHTKSNIHSSLSVELTQGCSVGCWFCALSPERLGGVFEVSESNRKIWRDVLTVLANYLGLGAKSGFLYWGTDPLDNPDYEQFCLDFHEILGVFPPTTTALALKDPSRTRALLKLSQDKGCWLNRFSILSIKMLDRVHAEFSPQELAQVECLPLNRESAFVYGNAGRFREQTQADPELMQKQRKKLLFAPWYTGDPSYADRDDYPLASIGCVTGFLVNMVNRTVQLISPCASSDRWPLGYYIYDEGRFENSEDLAVLLEDIINKRMSPVVVPSTRLRFHDWLRFEATEEGFQLYGRFHQQASFCDSKHSAQWRMIGQLVQEGGKTAREISQTVATNCNTNVALVQSLLNKLLHAGVLDELNN